MKDTCPICNNKFDTKWKLSNHILYYHNELVQEQKKLVCTLLAEGYKPTTIENMDDIYFGSNWINKISKIEKQKINQYFDKITQQLIIDFKSGKSCNDLYAIYKIPKKKIVFLLKRNLGYEEYEKFYKINKNKKISNSLKKEKANTKIEKECQNCKSIFITTKKSRKFCSKKCANILNGKLRGRKGGLISATKQNRRSKNEIYFAELCKNYFKIVKTNEPIFNGWDADVIIEDLKIAILWNGKWHYEKITKKHSLKQVQNRDKIKVDQIKDHGYIPYIIKDMGSENKIFVEKEFDKLLEYINTEV